MKWTIFIIFIAVSFSSMARANENIQVFVEQLINSNNLDSYWHIDIFPERTPVIVSLPRNIPLAKKKMKKFGKAVVFTHEPLNYKNVLSIQSITVKGNKTILEFIYSPEGIRGLATYKKKTESWKLISIEINEI